MGAKKISFSRFSEDAILKSKMQAQKKFYSGIIQLLGLRFVLQDTRIRSPADIEFKQIYGLLKPPFLNPFWRPPGVNFEWLQI